LDFRVPETDWRDGRPKLAAWYENFTQRPALRETVPQAPK
jgi:glutathione S-transferase